MLRRVGIVAWEQSKSELEKEEPREDMIYYLVKALLEKNEIKREEIDTVIQCSNDYYDGRTISNVFTVVPSGAYLKQETKVEQDGAWAVFYAMMRIASGHFDTALVVGYSKGSEFDPWLAHSYCLDPTYDRQFKFLNDCSCSALQARAYMEAYNLTPQDLALVSVKNLTNGAKNPLSARGFSQLTVEQVLESPLYSDPLRELMCYPFTDGACAIILASEEKAKKLTDKPVWILGVSCSQEEAYLGARDLTQLSSLKKSAEKAYKMAGINSPSEIGVFEVSEFYAHQELMITEALGLAEPGKGAELLKKGDTQLNGKHPVNPSGGALSANPLCATGMLRIMEAGKQLRGEAGEHQVDHPQLALAHGQYGICAQSNIVLILGR